MLFRSLVLKHERRIDLDFLKDLFKWFLKVLAAILVILVTCFLVYLTFGAATLSFMEFCQLAFAAFVDLGWYAIPVALGFGFLIDPDLTMDLVTSAGEAVVATMGALAEVAADAAGGILSGVLSSPIGIIAIGLGLYWLFSSSSNSEERIEIVQEGT
jgi:hypothetical protein